MSRIHELIKEKCPNGVEHKEIQELCVVTRGRVISKNELRENEGHYPVYSSQTLNNGVFGKINSYDFDGEFVQWTTDGAKAGSIFYRNGKFSVTNVCGLLKVKEEYKCIMNTNFLSYILGSVSKNYVNYATSNPKLMSNVMEKIKVAVPPLEVQEEIVRILDMFGKLEAELEAELEVRKQQYEFWRGKLFENNENNNKSYKLNEIASIYDGTHSTPNYQLSGVPFISVENINDIYSSNKFIACEDYEKYKIKPKINDVFMTRIGSIGKCFVLEKNIKLAYYVSLALIRPDNNIILSKYLKYYLESSIGQNELYKKTLLHAVPIKINKDDIGIIKVTVPSLKEQQRIVKVLDKFDKLVNDLSEGLPAEIELRRKQYEYYRNKLLRFEEIQQ